MRSCSIRSLLLLVCSSIAVVPLLGAGCPLVDAVGGTPDPQPSGQDIPSGSPLTVTCPQNIHRCTANNAAAVLLSAHVTSDAPPVTVTWRIDNNIVNVQTFPGPSELDNNVTTTQTLALGSYSVVVTVQDAAHGPVDCSTSVDVVLDQQAPRVKHLAVATPELSPPNHQLLNVGLTVSATDDCDLNPRITVAVYSDEPADAQGDGNTAVDAVDIAANTLRLSAERSGTGDGRVYLIIATAADDVSRQSSAACSVVVPHDDSADSITSVETQAATAVDTFINTGQPPPNFVRLSE